MKPYVNWIHCVLCEIAFFPWPEFALPPSGKICLGKSGLRFDYIPATSQDLNAPYRKSSLDLDIDPTSDYRLIYMRDIYTALNSSGSTNFALTHWGRVTHICVGNLTIIGSDNSLAPTNAGLLLIGPLEKNFNEILFEIDAFSFKKMHLKVLSSKWRPFYLGLNVYCDCDWVMTDGYLREFLLSILFSW